MFQPFALNQTMNTDFLIQLQLYTMLQLDQKICIRGLIRPEHFFTCERCSITNQKTPEHLEKRFHRESNSVFWPCYWIIPWIQTFCVHCSGIPSWLDQQEYQSTHGICCTTDHKTLRKLENRYCHEHQLVFWPFSVDQAMITHILGRYSSTEWWLIPRGHHFAHERCSTKDQKAPQHLENRLCHKGKSVFWLLILNQK